MEVERELVVGQRYRYYIPPTEYTIKEIVTGATNEEETGEMPPTAIYEQDVSGINPIGTRYARTVRDFLSQIQGENGQMVNKFELIEEPSQAKPGE